jgi:hypothetical protein
MMISLIFFVAPVTAAAGELHGARLALSLAGSAAFLVLYWRVMVGGWRIEDRAADDEAGAVDGTGLAGLAERVARVRGRMDAAPHGDGGFRLAVTVPLEAVT